MTYCDRCDRCFKNGFALHQHRRDSVFHHICGSCDKDFPTWGGLKEHYVQSSRHHYCQWCNCLYGSNDRLLKHYDDCHYRCKKHQIVFESNEGLRQHYTQSGDHYYCRFCHILFRDSEDLLDHGINEHFVCPGCDKLFRNPHKLQTHKACDHYYCKECDRVFTTKSNLDHHANSSLHKPRTIKCIGYGCTKTFITISALLLHAESGFCPAGITRKMVNEFAVRIDRRNVITNPTRLVCDSSGTRSAPVQREMWATERSWNNHGYECCLCHKEFRTLHALNAHLRSPVHSEKIYRCPMVGCDQEFGALSALVQHVERGGCGVGQSRQVTDIMDQLTNSMKRIAM